MKRALAVVLALVVGVAAISCNHDGTKGREMGNYSNETSNIAYEQGTTDQQYFTADLRPFGDRQMTQSNACGKAWFCPSSDCKTLQFKLNVQDLNGATAAHIHLGSAASDGPPVAMLYPGPSKSGSGTLAKGTITKSDLTGPMAGKDIPDLVREINNNNTYVNIHTEKFPQGEIRGTLRMDTAGTTSTVQKIRETTNAAANAAVNAAENTFDK